MTHMKTATLAILLLVASAAAHAQVPGPGAGSSLRQATGDLTTPTGILYDRVVGFSRIHEQDGSATAPAIASRQWRQMYHEIYGASRAAPAWPSLDALTARLGTKSKPGVVSIVVMDFSYDRLMATAREDGSLTVVNGRPHATGRGNPFERQRVFAAAAVQDYTYRGRRVVFSLDPPSYLTNREIPPQVQIDFDDGLGFRTVQLGRQAVVYYALTGRKTIRVRALSEGTILQCSFYFDVAGLATPNPDDTLSITATVAYDGQFATGEAYVYLAPGHTVPTQPIVVVEGFDLDNSMNWDELYAQLNQENLIEDMRALGYDAVVLNFAEATDHIQRNAFVVTELIQQVQSYLYPQVTIAAVGASMGGLVTRYALAWMEANAIDHRVRTFIAFDSPEHGANIPLGMQYWMKFFEGESADAAFLLSRLDTPAARQMLVYHYTDPPTSSGAADPLKADLDADFALIGNYPSEPHLVSVINGSGAQANQGFGAGDQIILYDYNGLFADVLGNIWAVPDGNNQMIFDGKITLFGIPLSQQQISVSGTLPYDGAPGGSRASMAQMDATAAPYGDIIALHDAHCFIPSISGLGLTNTGDPFYDIAGDPMIAANSVFDAVYYPAVNQGHVTVTPENKPWLIAEITQGPTAVPAIPQWPARRATLYQNTPNPFNPSTSIRFQLGSPEQVRLAVYDARGRHVVTLIDGELPAGERRVRWDGRDASGGAVASGVFFCRLDAGGATLARKMVLLK